MLPTYIVVPIVGLLLLVAVVLSLPAGSRVPGAAVLIAVVLATRSWQRRRERNRPLPPPRAIDLLLWHVRTLFTFDDRGRLLAVNDAAQAEPPFVLIGRTRDGNMAFFRHDVPDALAEELNGMVLAENPALPGPEAGWNDRYLRRVEQHCAVSSAWEGPALSFPAESPASTAVAVTPDNRDVLRRFLPEWLPDVAPGAPMAAVLHEGDAVSVCGSVRMTRLAHEAGVETHPDFRGRGHAVQAVAAWARAVRAAGATPLYSTRWDNAASLAVARKLGLRQYAATFSVAAKAAIGDTK